MSLELQICEDVPKPRHWPLKPMKCFGTIPGTEQPVFRIVFAPTVKKMVGGKFDDGFTGYRVVETYDYIGNKWILEKWVAAKDFTGQTELEYRAQWEDPETHLCLTGPYPREGAWQWVWTFQNTAQIDAHGIVAALVNKAKYNSKAAVAASLREVQKAEKRARFQKNFDRMKESMRAGGIRAANFGGRVKAMKSQPPLQDARKLGLPVRGARQIKASVGELEVAGY